MSSIKDSRRVSFSLEEKKDLLLTSAISSLIIFFLFVKLLWLHEEVKLTFIIFKIISLFFTVATILFLGLYVGKRVSLAKGYTAKYSSWKNGLLIGFVLSFISYGFIPLLFPGIIILNRIERQRHGKLYPGENLHEISFVIMFIEFTFVIISMIASLLFFSTHAELFYYFMTIAPLIAFFSLLPFNNNLGSHFFFSKPKLYFFFLFYTFFLTIFMFLRLYYAVILSSIGMILIYLLVRKILIGVLGKKKII